MNQWQQTWAVLLSLVTVSLAWSQVSSPSGFVPKVVAPTRPGEIAEPMAQPTPKPDGRITLELRDGSRLFGRPKAWTDFRLATRFGEVSVEMKEVMGIRFSNLNDLNDVDAGRNAHDGNTSDGSVPNDGEAIDDAANHDEANQEQRIRTTVHFNDGDIVSGELAAETMQLEATWGKSTIAVKEMLSIINSVNQRVWNWENGWRIRRCDEVHTYPATHGTAVPKDGTWHTRPTPPLVPVLPPVFPDEEHFKAPMPD